jgi:hypothetical protein
VITISHKSKQYLLSALKVIILAVTFGYIYFKIMQNDSLRFNDFIANLLYRTSHSFLIIVFLLLAALNWFFEILKWKTIVSHMAPLSFKTALEQSLSSLAVSLATPNRIGDYGAKLMYFEPEKRKQILLLNFFSNLVQMGVTCVFGLIGLLYVVPKYGISFSAQKLLIFLVCLLALGVLGYIFKEKQLLLKGLSIVKVVKHIQKISSEIMWKVVIYSISKYLVFSFLFYQLLLFFGASIAFSEAMPIIFCMYLLVSLIPTIFIFDLIVRGGVAVWLFSMEGIAELTVLSTVLAMWLLNFVIPAVWGSYYVAKFKLISQ